MRGNSTRFAVHPQAKVLQVVVFGAVSAKCEVNNFSVVWPFAHLYSRIGIALRFLFVSLDQPEYLSRASVVAQHFNNLNIRQAYIRHHAFFVVGCFHDS